MTKLRKNAVKVVYVVFTSLYCLHRFSYYPAFIRGRIIGLCACSSDDWTDMNDVFSIHLCVLVLWTWIKAYPDMRSVVIVKRKLYSTWDAALRWTRERSTVAVDTDTPINMTTAVVDRAWFRELFCRVCRSGLPATFIVPPSCLPATHISRHVVLEDFVQLDYSLWCQMHQLLRCDVVLSHVAILSHSRVVISCSQWSVDGRFIALFQYCQGVSAGTCSRPALCFPTRLNARLNLEFRC